MSDRYDATEMIDILKSINASISFEMDAENAQKLMKQIIHDLMVKCGNIERELRNCRNELCLKCGQYKDAHLGACDGCRYRHGGEWEEDLNE